MVSNQDPSINIPHDLIIPDGSKTIQIISKRKNHHRLLKRLSYKLRMSNVIPRKTDKPKRFHLGRSHDYEIKSMKYMNRTNAYRCHDNQDPLPDLSKLTNKYLLDLRFAKWITQK